MKYRVIKCTREVKAKDFKGYYHGITLDNRDISDEELDSFDTLDAAKENLAEYTSDVSYYSHTIPYYLVKEYYIDTVEYDEDGDISEYGDILEFAKCDYKHDED